MEGVIDYFILLQVYMLVSILILSWFSPLSLIGEKQQNTVFWQNLQYDSE